MAARELPGGPGDLPPGERTDQVDAPGPAHPPNGRLVGLGESVPTVCPRCPLDGLRPPLYARPMSSLTGWPPMIWIGGAPGAGKSTLAWELSRLYDLPLHALDLGAYDHAGRLMPWEPLDEELGRGPAYAARGFETYRERRLPLLCEDVRRRGLEAVPALVEGPQFYPRFAHRAGIDSRRECG